MSHLLDHPRNSAVAFVAIPMVVLLCSMCHVFAQENAQDHGARLNSGKTLYEMQCLSCHGDRGQGIAGKYDETLYGDKSLEELTKIIHDTMPEEDPKKVVGEDAAAVATYLYETFYTAESRARNQPPRIELVRLTNRQYANVITDLMANFLGQTWIDSKQGLSAQYHDSRNLRRDKRVFERTDPEVAFNFKDGSPGEGIGIEEFSIQWNGSVIAEETGNYEFCVRTENGFRLWVNNSESALIDGWVVSGDGVADHRESIYLLGGRPYSIRLEYFKFKEKSASIELRWTPPGGVDEVVPERQLFTTRVPESILATTPFPPDDASLGYERGSGISKAWGQATTQSAIDIANQIVNRLDRFADTKREDGNREEKIRSFCHRFTELAFRRPLTEEQKQLFVDQHFEKAADLEEAVKRIVILTLQSPQFLYPELTDASVDSYDVAARLSFGLWDSLPDQALLQAAARGELLDPKQVREQAWRMLKNKRTAFKLQGFFHELLPFHEARELAKDKTEFPEFDAQVVADLKTSLEMFIHHVVWSERSDYRELLLSSDLYLNSRLAKMYDVEVSSEQGFEKVTFDPQQRSGVVTHPFLLSTLAYQQASSPIHRGVFVTRKILNRSLKPPPMAIEFKDSTFDPALTMREKVAELTKSQSCMTCHSTINPLGFSLENYDAVGRYRTMDREKPVNSTSEFVAKDGEIVTFTGARDVAEYAVRDEIAQRGFIEHLFHHTVKQPARAYGEETLEVLRTKFAGSEYNIQRLLVEINVLVALHGVPQNQGE